MESGIKVARKWGIDVKGVAAGAGNIVVARNNFHGRLAAYSAVNFGHRNPEIIATAHAQLDTATLVSRAFHSDRLGPFCEALTELCGKDMVLPMNSAYTPSRTLWPHRSRTPVRSPVHDRRRQSPPVPSSRPLSSNPIRSSQGRAARWHRSREPKI